MFGRPSQHLLPSQPKPSTEDSSTSSDPATAPVQLAPLPFKDFRFNLIGKQPELLSRISLPQSGIPDYHSPTPSPSHTPPPTFTNGVQSQSSSRLTLLEQLAGSDSSSADGNSKRNAPASQSIGSLASRIQMNDSPSNDSASAPGAASGFPPPHVSITRRATEDASLIPPVEVLSQLPDSSPATPASWAPTQELANVRSPANSASLVNTTTITTSRIPTPPAVATDSVSSGPIEPLPSLAVVDPLSNDPLPSPSSIATIDSLVTRQVRLQSISAKLANLAPPLPPPSSQSPPADSSITMITTDVNLGEPSQSQLSLTPVALCHPFPANLTPDQAGSSTGDTQTSTNASSLALIHPPTTLTQEFQTQGRAIAAAVENLHSVLNAAHRTQIDSENALALTVRTFEERRATFEQTKRADEATLRQAFHELQQKREELSAREALLVSLEKESKAREEARRAVLAKRQAQEEEKRAAEAKRVEEVQEQIAIAENELKELEARREIEQLASETIQSDLPTEPQENMNEEESAVIKSRNELTRAVKHLRRMHTDKVQKLEEVNRTLRRLGVERKNREAEEAERRQVEEEDRLRPHAQIAQARQLLDEKRRQFEVERRRQDAENERDWARLLVEQQAHAEAQAHGLGCTETAGGGTYEHPDLPRTVSASQQQEITDTAGIRAVRDETTYPPETTDAMNMDDDGMAPGFHHPAPSSDTRTSPGTLPRKQKDKPISGGVMLAAPTLKASPEHLPPKPLTTLSSHSSSGHVAENVSNPVIPASAEGSQRSSFPAQPALAFNRTVNADIRSTPDHKRAFSRAPKSQTILDATNGGSQELNIGPVSGVSPTQQNVNLRHLKRVRGRGEGNDSGDRSVRTVQVKSEEISYLSPKTEELDDQSHDLTRSTVFTNTPASLPSRPAIIPPPRPRMSKKNYEVPAPQTDSSSSNQTASNELSSKKEAKVTTEQPREALHRDAPSSQAMDVPAQSPASSEAGNFLLLGPVYTEPQVSVARVNAGERSTQDRGKNYDSTSSELSRATLWHGLDGEDPSRNNRRLGNEHRRARNANGSQRVLDHYSPPLRSTITSPTEGHRVNDSWRPQNSSNGHRAEPMRAPSPTVGKKRPSEFNDNEHGRRVRRQRDDVWIARDHDRVDSYRHWDRRVDSESDDHRPAYRVPTSPVDRTRPYLSDVPRATYDNRTFATDEPIVTAARREQSRRTENDETYQWYQPSAPAHSPMADQHYMDGARVGQTYEPMMGERMDTQSDPPLLARIRDTQYFPPRGRGRGEPSRGRGEFGRGRGRGIARGGTPLLDRLTSGPSSLEERITGI